MSLASGTRVGVYEITGALGAGGMGEVYRARDTKLGRDVAIKVLPESFAHDSERVARFQREAQLLAALNHPHIASIYGLDETSGAQLLVMELVEGETLADRLRAGPLPVGEALAIARQVADALEAAHEKGIIHRDLKPANIALTEQGQVKVLDFGLAKALGPADAGAHDHPGLTHSPTLTIAGTQAGVILGTAAYMAPEQAKGRAATRRSDVWAFGCVLYEMLSGARPFDGEDVSDTLAAVLRADPDWKRLPATLPRPIGTLLRACLEKDWRRRPADISVAIFTLDRAAELGGGADTADVNVPNRRRLVLAGAAAIALAALAATGTWLLGRDPSPRVTRLSLVTAGASALLSTGNDRDVAITPDGTRVVYRGTNQLLVHSLDQLEPVALSGLGEPRAPFISPDGQWVGFFDGNSPMKKVAITGGPPVTIAAVESIPRGATWGDDDTIVFATSSPGTGLFRVSASGGEPAVLTTPDPARGEGDHLWPEFLPGSQTVLFTIALTGSTVGGSQIAALDLTTGTFKVIVRGGSHAHYVATGHLVYSVDGALRAVPFDRTRLEVTGTAVPVMEQVRTSGVGGMNAAIAANGTLVYMLGGVGGAGRTLVWVDRTGREEPIGAPQGNYQSARISPDGTRVALDVRERDFDIWIWDLLRRTLTRLTFDAALDGIPVWTADSNCVIFASQRSGASSIFWQAADGTGPVERLTEGAANRVPRAVTKDGRLVIRETNSGTFEDLGLIDLQRPTCQQPASPTATPRVPQPLLKTRFAESNADVSADGRWLAYQSDESGRQETYVRPFPDVEAGRWQVSAAGGRMPLWSRDGRELFFVSPDDALMGVRVESGPAWRHSPPARVLPGRYVFGGVGATRTFGGTTSRMYDIAPDGRRFLMVKDAVSDDEAAAQRNLVVVQNWFEELKRLVPIN